MGAALAQAQSWRGKRSKDLPAVDREFIDQSTKREAKIRVRARRVQALIYVLLVGIILGLIGIINQAYIKEQVHWYMTMRPYRVANVDPYVLTPERERALRPGDSFRECAKDCPEMVVVPAGEFTMGSPATEKGRWNEGPQHSVAIPRPFAVSKFEVTFADWDACVAVGGCPHENRASDGGWGRGRQPVIGMSWDDAQAYVAWLSRMTGKTYRLLTETEWEYAARAGSQAAYSWGDEIGKGNANCNGCGSQWDNKRTAPVGSFAANAFGLHDMHGNVWEWVEDCEHENYNGAPKDGSAWIEEGECGRRVLRGGSWNSYPRGLRAARRDTYRTYMRGYQLGFRVGRTLSAGAGAITVAPGAH
jgi:formylglycine-generating enzyme required for sulfatase activity